MSSWSRTAAAWLPRFCTRSKASSRWAAFLSRFSQVAPGAEVATLLINGAVAARVQDGRIARIYAMRNPDKLGRLDDVAELRR